MKKVQLELRERVRVGGRIIQSIKFANDKAIVCNDEARLQRMVYILNRTTERYGMRIIESRTKLMKITK